MERLELMKTIIKIAAIACILTPAVAFAGPHNDRNSPAAAAGLTANFDTYESSNMWVDSSECHLAAIGGLAAGINVAANGGLTLPLTSTANLSAGIGIVGGLAAKAGCVESAGTTATRDHVLRSVSVGAAVGQTAIVNIGSTGDNRTAVSANASYTSGASASTVVQNNNFSSKVLMGH